MPILTVIAGPNGAGKTRLSIFFKHVEFISTDPINIDQINKKIDDSFISYDFLRVEEQKRKQVNKIFLQEAEQAIEHKRDFCFESNLSTMYQISPIKLFDDAGYDLHLIYVMLDSIERSKSRVRKRSQFEKGHFVSDENISINFYGGLRILNDSFQDWNRVFLLDNNAEMDVTEDHTKVLLVAEKGKVVFFNEKPTKHLHSYIPKIIQSIHNHLHK